jgi:succinylarginine dihydrolase
VGNDSFLMLHASAFEDTEGLLATLKERLGPAFTSCLASEKELGVTDAVAAYPFNSQVLTLPQGGMCILAPKESEERQAARAFLERVLHEDNPVQAVHYLDVRESMNNGGGPACLRQRIRLTEAERSRVGPRVFYDEALHRDLEAWVKKHYRDRLAPDDLRDPALAREGMVALDVLTQLLALGSVYDFQKS